MVAVTNQGLLDLHNVEIVNTIPDETSLVSASGPSSYSVAGRVVTFDPVATITPVETLTYNITVLAEAEGFALNLASMTYDEFGSPVTTQEGTTIYTLP